MSRKLNVLARYPSAMNRFLATGRMPQERPIIKTPLFMALDAIGPRHRQALHGLTVGPALGYQGSRLFHTAEQAFRWVGGYECPRLDCQPSLASESWIDRRFCKPITWGLLKSQVACNVPDSLALSISRCLDRARWS